jgi:hypothetical protein
MAWEPIETAPTDGTRVVLSNGSYVGIGRKSEHIGGGLEWTLETERLTEADVNNIGFWAVTPVQWQPLPIPDPQYIGPIENNPNPKNPLRSGNDGK